MKDSLGDRIKSFYEDRAKTYLTRRTYTILRLDGKSFHSYTKGMDKPFDGSFTDAMVETAVYLCEEIQGCKLAYVQSDEISLLLTDFTQVTTDAWFDGNVQKMVSVSASLATAIFNTFELKPGKLAIFDSRAFTIPYLTEVINYFLWRQQDATRNSINSAAQALYSHKELHEKSCSEMQEMMFQKGVNWNNYPDKYKRGTVIIKESDGWKALEETPYFDANDDSFFDKQIHGVWEEVKIDEQ
jgi:tRNA(His) guanylyltransferase